MYATYQGLLLLTLAATPAAQAWPQLHGNSRHDGVLPVSIAPASVSLRWGRTLLTDTLDRPTLQGGRVFVGANRRRFFALGAQDGSTLWEIDLSSFNASTAAALGDNAAYLHVAGNVPTSFLFARDLVTGREVFRATHASENEGYVMPTLWRDRVYLKSGARLLAYRATDGGLLWSFPVLSSSLAGGTGWTPAVDDHAVYVFVGGELTAVDHDGALLFSIRPPDVGSSNGTPALGGHDDLFLTGLGAVVRVDLNRRAMSWSLRGTFSGTPCVRDDTLYVRAAGALQARHSVTGAPLWEWRPQFSAQVADMVITRDHAVVTDTSFTALLDLTTRQEVWRVPRGGTVAVGDNMIVVSTFTLETYQYVERPYPIRMVPSRAPYGQTALVTIQGSGFAQGGPLHVAMGGQDATDVVVVDDDMLTCRTPRLGPGRHEVTVRNSLGQLPLAGGFVAFPALELLGDQAVGGTIRCAHTVARGDELLLLLSGAPGGPWSIPPFQGALQIDSPLLIAYFARQSGQGVALDIPVPDAAALRGARLWFQSLAGQDLLGQISQEGAFTNAVVSVIR